LKKFFEILILMIMLSIGSGCVKDETIMSVNKNKSVDLVVNLGYPINSNRKLTIEEVKEKVGDEGYFIDSYHDDKYVGYSISKQYKNINDISSSKEINLNLPDILNGKFDDSKLFTVKKGFFKNTYTANFTYDVKKVYNYNIIIELYGLENNGNCNEIMDFLEENYKDNELIKIQRNNIKTAEDFQNFKEKIISLNTEYKELPTIIINDRVFVGITDDVKKEIKEYISELDSGNNYELTYKANIPFKILNNNATSKEGNTLIWKCNYFDENKISYSFQIFKIGSIILIIFIILIAILIIFLINIIRIKMKMDKEKFIAKNSDISNITPSDDNETNTIMSINDIIKK